MRRAGRPNHSPGTPSPSISNRHSLQLEIPATHSKHSPAPVSNRHKFSLVGFCLSRLLSDCGRSSAVGDELPLCLSLHHSQNVAPQSHLSILASVSPALPAARRLATTPKIRKTVNRHSLPTKISVTHTKHSPPRFENRHKFAPHSALVPCTKPQQPGSRPRLSYCRPTQSPLESHLRNAFGAVAKWEGKGLQNLYSAVRFRPAPPISPASPFDFLPSSLPYSKLEVSQSRLETNRCW